MRQATYTKRSTLAFLILLLASAVLWPGEPIAMQAQSPGVPRLVQFSGVLKDEAGRPLTGIQGVTLALYNKQADGPALWQETQNVTADSDGRFVVLLGATSPTGLPIDLFTTGQAQWLGVQAAGQPEQPRSFLSSVPYALANGTTPSTNTNVVETSKLRSTDSVTSALTGPPTPPIFSIVTNPGSGLTSTNDGAGTATLSMITTCSVGQLLKWNGSAWGCTADVDVNIDVFGGGLRLRPSPRGAVCARTGTGLSLSPSSIGGSEANSVPLCASGAFIGGGGFADSSGKNSNHATSFGTVSGGIGNLAGNGSLLGGSTVGGGHWNQATGDNSTIAGGDSNAASGQAATIPGGAQNTAAGKFSFAAGYRAKANDDGTFVWADSTDVDFSSTGKDQFLIRASGGVGINITTSPTEKLEVNGKVKATGLVIPTGAGAGKVLTSDANGNGTWISPSGGSGVGVTQVTAGAGLTGGTITSTGTIGIAPNGVTNGMLQNSTVNITAGPGLSGGGTAPLGGSVTLGLTSCASGQLLKSNGAGGWTCAADNSAAGVTAIVLGTGLADGSGATGGTITSTGTVKVDTNLVPTLGAANVFTAPQTVTTTTGTAVTATNSASTGSTFGVFATSASDSGSTGYFQNTNSSGKALIAATNSGAEALTVLAAGKVGIDQPNPSEALEVNGNVKATKFIGDGSGLSNLPGGGSVTSITAGSGLNSSTTNPITTSGTLSIATGGVTNAMLQNSTVTLSPLSGLTGGGTIALGASVPLSVDTSVIQKRVSDTKCVLSGGAIQTVNPDGSVTCVAVGSSGGISGSGTANKLTKFTGTTTVGDSQISDDGTNVKISVTGGGLRLVANGTGPDIIGGFSGNTVSDGVYGATIAGGGNSTAPNTVTKDAGTVSGGTGNTSALFATVSGGATNTASGTMAAVGGGQGNTASDSYSIVSGGLNNTASSQYATVTGGLANIASGLNATVSGGAGNIASGTASFAAGTWASAKHDGTFVWADSTAVVSGFPFESTAHDQFLISAHGGVGIGTNNPASGMALDVNGNVKATAFYGDGSHLTGLSGGGTITGVTTAPGSGLIGGGTSGNLSLSIPAGGVTIPMLQNSSVTVSAGTGLSGGGPITLGGIGTLNVNTSVIQSRVSGFCSAGAAIQSVDVSGSVNCMPVGVAGSGTVGKLPMFITPSTLGDSVISEDTSTGTVVIGVMNGPGVVSTGGITIQSLPVASPNIISGISGNSGSTGGGNTISGGGDTGNFNQATGKFGTIGGGSGNKVGDFGTVGGGSNNNAQAPPNVLGGTIGGGSNNIAVLNGTVGGGDQNRANGPDSMIPGGQLNTASGSGSFAAGRQAKANNQGSFVWGDSNPFDVTSIANNDFTARATGGVRFISAISGTTPTGGVSLAPGGGSWSSLSDRNAKENFSTVDGNKLLDKLNAISVETWNYKAQDKSTHHMGPMAQDFYAAFGLGEDDTHISTVDADGVALAAIQALYRLSKEKDTQIEQLNRQLEQTRADMELLKARLGVELHPAQK
jgi:hypothetical protein